MQKVCIPNILFKTVCNQYYYYSIHSKYFAKSIFQSIYSEYFALLIFNSIHSEYIYFVKSLVYSPHDPGDGVPRQPLPHHGDGVVEDGEWQGDVVLDIVRVYY